VKYLQELLEEIGLGAERVKMVNVSAAMGVQFAQNAQEFSETIYEIGPNPINTVTEETAL
jgi:coenzyme F420-reducing hydrogenase delta subunit